MNSPDASFDRRDPDRRPDHVRDARAADQEDKGTVPAVPGIIDALEEPATSS